MELDVKVVLSEDYKRCSEMVNKQLVCPQYQTSGAGALDVHAIIDKPISLAPGEEVMIDTGMRMAIPYPWVGVLNPRSGLGCKAGLVLGNGQGWIDSDYRGPVKVCAVNRKHFHDHRIVIAPFDRIAQLGFVSMPHANLIFTDTLDETDRGCGGFGSTGGNSHG